MVKGKTNNKIEEQGGFMEGRARTDKLKGRNVSFVWDLENCNPNLFYVFLSFFSVVFST